MMCVSVVDSVMCLREAGLQGVREETHVRLKRE
jgi:hypothetical protein